MEATYLFQLVSVTVSTFFYQGFLSQTVMRWLSFIPLYQFHPLMKIEIYLQLCMWVDYHMFLIATLVFTRLLHNKIYHLIELPFDWLMMQCLFVYLMNWFRVFCDSDLKWKTGGSEPASSIIPVLQANRLTKSASHLQERSSE